MIKRSLKNYDVYLTENALTNLNPILSEHYKGNVLHVITDETVYKTHGDTSKNVLKNYTVTFTVVPPGEKSKSLSTYHTVIKNLIKNDIKRDHLIIAFGGGVIGDLAGFVAATLYRGIPFIQVPTTLLACVDSSVGSKVAIDLEEGKNLVGAFYDPLFVFIDLQFLKTLPKREWNNGLAEILKAGLIQDAALYQKLIQGNKVDIDIILNAIEIKLNLVEKDPYDLNERMLLNFGHAIEKVHGYDDYKHGEAISYGMLIALKIGEKLNVTPPSIYPQLKTFLLNQGIINEPLLRAEKYLPHLKNDKKARSNDIQFILLETMGKAVIVTLKVGDLT